MRTRPPAAATVSAPEPAWGSREPHEPTAAVREALCAVLPDGESPTASPASRTRAGLLGLHRALGERRLLAPHWPIHSGGLGGTFADSAYVVERLVRSGNTDTLIVNSVYNAGHALLRTAPGVHRNLIRRIASGHAFSAVLFTEAQAGSDLACVATRAERRGDGWSLTGAKTWIAQADLCDYGICLARTGGEPGDMVGLSLFLIPLGRGGVTVTELHSTWSEPLFEVALDDVRVTAQALIGAEGGVWDLADELLMMERASPGYWARGAHWCDQLAAQGARLDTETGAELTGELERAEALSQLAVGSLAAGRPDPLLVSMAKYRGTEASRRVAEAAARAGAAGATAWFEEASGLVLAAGSTEMMLRQILPDLVDVLDDSGR